jgi:hypothetical protein
MRSFHVDIEPTVTRDNAASMGRWGGNSSPSRRIGPCKSLHIHAAGLASCLYCSRDVTGSPLRRQFIRHNPTGQIWAVEILDGAVLGVVGPLGRIDVDPILLDHLGLDMREIPWITSHAGEFTQMDGQAFEVARPSRKPSAKVSIPARAEERRTD